MLRPKALGPEIGSIDGKEEGTNEGLVDGSVVEFVMDITKVKLMESYLERRMVYPMDLKMAK